MDFWRLGKVELDARRSLTILSPINPPEGEPYWASKFCEKIVITGKLKSLLLYAWPARER